MLKKYKAGEFDIVYISGKLMGGPETEDFRMLVDEVRKTGSDNLIIDLSELQWLNSAGIGALISSYVLFCTENKKIRFANLSPKVKDVLKITRLDTILDIYGNVEEAKQDSL